MNKKSVIKMIESTTYQNYVSLLKSELIPALGCTEPIAIAYAAAKAKEILATFPDKMIVECSGNIIKNVKGVIVPTTNDLRGVDTSAILGVVGGVASKKLEVLSDIQPIHVEKTRALLKTGICEVKLKKGVANLYIKVTLIDGENSASVELVETHTNIATIEKNGKTLYTNKNEQEQDQSIKSIFNVDTIYEFANTVEINDIEDVIETQIKYNTKIANEGLVNCYGANVGKTLMKVNADIKTQAKAYAAAGSDARMAGCTLPVVINSGSGNQGITVSLPIIKYAEYLKSSREKLIRALVLANLLALYQKAGIGKLSAYCGAVSAACGSGAGIAYLYDAPLDVIKMTIKNVLGNVSGIVCDGAKSSCAAKIASSVDAAIMGYEMAINGYGYLNGEGLNLDDVDETIENVSMLAKQGMKETDVEILALMLKK
jgi:L-cysteine desulfidase